MIAMDILKGPGTGSTRRTAKGRRSLQRDDEWSLALEKIATERCKQSFAAFFTHFSPLLKGFLLKGSRLNSAQAEELVQDIMIKVWRRAAQFDSTQASASTWLYTIARNARIDWLRRQSNAETEELIADDLYEDETGETPFTQLQQARREETVHEALTTLPEEQALVLRKVYMESKSHSEVSEELDLPLGTVKSRVRLALKKLQDVIGRELAA
ncbi:sigma-24 FecI-like protein [Simiduia agarivorans SA1 = DSM 21679]|uniref:Sigma-24 FecI-like protein n=1 Tax=Simiduia agarivorans (strain DSM 21679 / JCM 13881 / BCRC 17597 / SA1) TaxID=1117647 RepID=K4KKN5_SIMAS|nr:sigma-24 FecI-like protein [Simiduia agarivorans SA1 = DSM 21679]